MTYQCGSKDDVPFDGFYDEGSHTRHRMQHLPGGYGLMSCVGCGKEISRIHVTPRFI